MKKYVLEYLRRSDLAEDLPDVHVRHCIAQSEDDAREALLSRDPRGDIVILSVSTVEAYLEFSSAIVNDPEACVEALGEREERTSGKG